MSTRVTKKVVWRKSLKEVKLPSSADIWRGCTAGQRHSQCKGPGAEKYLGLMSIKKAKGKSKRKMLRGDVRWTMEGKSGWAMEGIWKMVASSLGPRMTLGRFGWHLSILSIYQALKHNLLFSKMKKIKIPIFPFLIMSLQDPFKILFVNKCTMLIINDVENKSMLDNKI